MKTQMLMSFFLMSLVSFSAKSLEAVEVSKASGETKSPVKAKKAVMTGKSLLDLYQQFSSSFRNTSQGELRKVLENLKNRELVSNTSADDYATLISTVSDGPEVMHEIFIYLGAFPLADKEKEREGIRTSIATNFQTFALKNKKVDPVMLQADIDSMERLTQYLKAEENKKVIKLPTGIIPELPKKAKKKK
ncbi:hypothetical protein HON41_03730 [bacterium]|nr:hypothetical protein [bacterium]